MENKNNLNPIRGSPNLRELILKNQENQKIQRVNLLRSKSTGNLNLLDESETDSDNIIKPILNSHKILNMNYVELIRKYYK